MIIEQRETNPVFDLFWGLHVSEAVKTIRNLSDEEFADTENINLACEETISIIKNFQKKLGDLEKKLSKQSAKKQFLEKLSERSYDD